MENVEVGCSGCVSKFIIFYLFIATPPSRRSISISVSYISQFPLLVNLPFLSCSLQLLPVVALLYYITVYLHISRTLAVPVVFLAHTDIDCFTANVLVSVDSFATVRSDKNPVLCVGLL
jgi:hypothetical protein